MDSEKKRRGRPKKLPHGKPTRVRLELFNGETEKLKAASEAAGMKQAEFARAAVLHAADTVLEIKPATAKPTRKRKP